MNTTDWTDWYAGVDRPTIFAESTAFIARITAAAAVTPEQPPSGATEQTGSSRAY